MVILFMCVKKVKVLLNFWIVISIIEQLFCPHLIAKKQKNNSKIK